MTFAERLLQSLVWAVLLFLTDSGGDKAFPLFPVTSVNTDLHRGGLGVIREPSHHEACNIYPLPRWANRNLLRPANFWWWNTGGFSSTLVMSWSLRLNGKPGPSSFDLLLELGRSCLHICITTERSCTWQLSFGVVLDLLHWVWKFGHCFSETQPSKIQASGRLYSRAQVNKQHYRAATINKSQGGTFPHSVSPALGFCGQSMNSPQQLRSRRYAFLSGEICCWIILNDHHIRTKPAHLGCGQRE